MPARITNPTRTEPVGNGSAIESTEVIKMATATEQTPSPRLREKYNKEIVPARARSSTGRTG